METPEEKLGSRETEDLTSGSEGPRSDSSPGKEDNDMDPLTGS